MGFPIFNRSTNETIDFDTKEERDQYVSDKDFSIYQGYLPELIVKPKRSLLQQGSENFEDTFGITPRDVIGFVPYVGDALDAKDIVSNLNEDKYKEAGIGATMLLLPNILEKPLKYVYKSAKNLSKVSRNLSKSRNIREASEKLIHPNRTASASNTLFDEINDSPLSLEELERAASKVRDIRQTTGYSGDMGIYNGRGSYRDVLEDIYDSESNIQSANSIISSYFDKMNSLKDSPILYDIATKSPQYLDIIHKDYINGIDNIEEYVRGLISRSNTFMRRMDPKSSITNSRFTPDDFLTIRSSKSPGLPGDVQSTSNIGYINVGNEQVVFPHYGSRVGLYTPKEISLTGDVSTWWDQRFPIFNNGIDVKHGMHQSQFRDLGTNTNYAMRRGLEAHLAKNGVPFQYGNKSGHIVFSGPKGSSIGDKFNVTLFNNVPNIPLTLGYKGGGNIIYKNTNVAR